MKTTNLYEAAFVTDGRRSGPSVTRRSRWAALLICALLVWTFMFVIAPLLSKFPVVVEVQESIKQTGIDASALYYTEVDEALESGMYLRNSNEYSPAGAD